MLSVNEGTWPVPLRPTDCGLPVALSAKEMAADLAPPALGEKVALTEQAAPAAKLPAPTGHVSAEIVKSPGLVPPKTTLLKVTGLLPVLVTVTVRAALVVPVFCKANVRLVGLKPSVKVGALVPVPLSSTDRGLPVKLPAMERAPLRAPVPCGLKSTLTKHDNPAPRLDKQVLAETAKSPALAPVSPKPVRETVLLPVFVIVMPWEELVVPCACVANVRFPGCAPMV